MRGRIDDKVDRRLRPGATQGTHGLAGRIVRPLDTAQELDRPVVALVEEAGQVLGEPWLGAI